MSQKYTCSSRPSLQRQNDGAANTIEAALSLVESILNHAGRCSLGHSRGLPRVTGPRDRRLKQQTTQPASVPLNHKNEHQEFCKGYKLLQLIRPVWPTSTIVTRLCIVTMNGSSKRSKQAVWTKYYRNIMCNGAILWIMQTHRQIRRSIIQVWIL